MKSAIMRGGPYLVFAGRYRELLLSGINFIRTKTMDRTKVSYFVMSHTAILFKNSNIIRRDQNIDFQPVLIKTAR